MKRLAPSVFALALACGTGSGRGAGGPTAPPREAAVYVSGGAGVVEVFALDRATGALARRAGVPAGRGPSYLAWDAAPRHLYALNGGQPNRALAFRIGAGDGVPVEIAGGAAEIPATSGATHLSVHPSGRWVFVAHFGSGHATVLPVRPDGGVGPPTDVQRPAEQAHQIVTDSRGRFVFVPCRDGNVVAQYRFDAAAGKLAPNQPFLVSAEPGAGPRHMAFHPSGKWAYVINEKNGTMTSYRYDADKGLLEDPESLPTVPEGVEETAAAHVVVHPSGRFVYGSNRVHQSIVVFAVDAATGRLRLVGHETGGGLVRTPRDFVVDPTGALLLVANQRSSSVLVFRIDGATGRLARAGAPVPTAAGPAFVGVL